MAALVYLFPLGIQRPKNNDIISALKQLRLNSALVICYSQLTKKTCAYQHLPPSSTLHSATRTITQR
jgi:hypothetical protein